jgi:hypothetical protein
MKKPEFIENRGRPKENKYPQKKGEWIALSINSRQAAYQDAWRNGYKIKTWINNGQLIVERLS